jgi:hypothetical protein
MKCSKLYYNLKARHSSPPRCPHCESLVVSEYCDAIYATLAKLLLRSSIRLLPFSDLQWLQVWQVSTGRFVNFGVGPPQPQEKETLRTRNRYEK